MILCDRPCSNKSEYGYCNTTYCINPVIPNTAVGYFPPPRLIKTNADRIRSMTDDELVEFLYWDADGSGKSQEQWLRWLKEEVKG